MRMPRISEVHYCVQDILASIGLAFSSTTFAVITYAFIFSGILVSDHLSRVPRNTRGLDLNEAWADLHVITTAPHPYNSHANDVVRSYLLSRLEPLAAAHSHVHLSDDLQSNGTWDQTYFEGNNILLKIDGTDLHADAVLFSAHYDSVSTSKGATDDGMAIVTLLQLVKKFSRKRYKRTAIFNFNNGEEDYLNGAHAFLQHPWSNLTTTFLNLEGAASGGRPLLFRATSTTPLRSFLPPHVSRPHTNVLAADVFNSGVIRSETDYVVYEERHRMEGLDLAFYKGRSRYHTRYDAIPWLEGQERALWAMMENADGAGDALLSQPTKTQNSEAAFPLQNDAVYFDLFGRIMILFSLDKLRIYNIVFLATVPVGTALLLVFQTRSTNDRGEDSSSFSFAWIKFWIVLFLAISAQVLLTFFVTKFNPFVVYSSPYLVLLSALVLTYLTFVLPLSVSLPQNWRRSQEDATNHFLFQLMIFSYFILFLPTVGFPPIGGTYLLSVLATCSFASWAVGIVGKVLIGSSSAPHTAFSVGQSEVQEELVNTFSSDSAVDSTWQGQGQEESWNRSSARPVENVLEEEAEEPTESTPLMQSPRRDLDPFTIPSRSSERWSRWISILRKVLLEKILAIQFLLAVPIPVTLFAHITVLLIGALPQSITDGGPVWIVYAALSTLSVFLLLPVVPFLPSPYLALSESLERNREDDHNVALDFIKNHPVRPFVRIATVIFIFTVAFLSGFFGITLTSYMPGDRRIGFPFSAEEPLKVFFEQKVELRAEWKNQSVGINPISSFVNRDELEAFSRTYLIGIPKYLDKFILPALPSAREAVTKGGINCERHEKRTRLFRCGWESGRNMLPFPGDFPDASLHGVGEQQEYESKALVLAKNPWLRSALTRSGETQVRITLEGRNTRACRVYIDKDGADVKSWRVAGGKGGGGVEKGSGIHMVRLWSRIWGRKFVVDFEVEPGKKMSGKVACEWVEYESGLVGVPYGASEGQGGTVRPRIPAYEEVLSFLPRWAVSTKGADGLVEVWSYFSI